jgi:hypothetical protein
VAKLRPKVESPNTTEDFCEKACIMRASSLVNQAGKSIIFRPDDPGVELIASVGDPAVL